jgi:energy-coupling factor transport system ATP-binding protein
VLSFNPIKNMALEFDDFSFIYGNNKNQRPAVSNISFNLKEGDVLILAGPSGSGKSTLSYAMNGIIPWRQKGLVKGNVRVFGKNILDYEFSELSKLIGLVKQNPNDQLITFNVRDEIAFGLENLNLPHNVIDERINTVSNLMGINHLLDRDIEQLSGGQKQLVVLSSFLVMNPKILILDEPIAFLDQQSESLLLNRLKFLIESKNITLTLVIIEHRLSRVMDIADKLIILNDQGNISLKGDINGIFTQKFEELNNNNLRIPWIIDIFHDFIKSKRSIKNHNYPTTFQELLDIIPSLEEEDLNSLHQIVIDKEINPKGLQKYDNFEELIEFEDIYIKSLKDVKRNLNAVLPDETDGILETRALTFNYPNSGIIALENLNLKINKSDFIGLVGPNGSGKTTLLYLLANLYKPTSGQIYYKQKNIEEINQFEYAKTIGFIFQNPENMIFRPNIEDELLYGPKNFGILDNIKENYKSKLLNLVGKIDPQKSPYNLSWGQKRRLNLSSIFIYNPEIILLDEPFIGQDQRTIDSLIETLYIENKRGKTIIISSHDYHLLLKYTKKIIELNKDGTLRDYDISSNYFQKHRNLGPIILLEEIKKRLKDGLNEK